MDARELRIGNLMELPNGEISKVTGFTENGKVWFVREPKHEECALKINQVKPVPLTEEWLFEFGFINDFSKDFRVRLIGYRLGDFFITEKMKLLTSDINSVKIKYVHQLQNLYFALTGEELTIKN